MEKLASTRERRPNKDMEPDDGETNQVKKDVDQPWKIIMQNVRGLITAGSRETLKLIESYTNNDKIILMNFTETWLDKTMGGSRFRRIQYI